MPTMPAETKALKNGLHTLIALEVETRQGDFGEQEAVTCIEQDSGEQTRVWISHKSRKQIQAAEAVGLVEINGEEWHVVIGARFQAMIAGGKCVGYVSAPPQVVMNGTTGEEKKIN